MNFKSINIIFTALAISACQQELAETNYKSTVSGYSISDDDKSVFAVDNRELKQNTAPKAQSANNVPVLYSDPFAVGRGLTPAPTTSNPYGTNTAYSPLGYAPAGTFGSNVIMQNNTPAYQQAPIGVFYDPNNPVRRY